MDGTSPARAMAWQAGAVVCCAAACLSNAAGAVIPLLTVTWDMVVPPRARWWAIVLRAAPLVAVAATTIAVKRLSSRVPTTAFLPDVFSLEWGLLVLTIYGLNVKTLLWPDGLALYYNWPPGESYADPEILLGAAAAALTLVLLWKARRQRLALFGLLWFLLSLGPASQVMPHHLPRADRFLYLPLAGLALSLAAVLRGAPRLREGRRVAAALIAVGTACLLVLVVLSTRQVRTWRNGVAVWSHCLAVEPDNPMAHSGLADALSRQGRFDLAIPHYHMALRLDPRSRESLNNFALRLAADDREDLRDYDLAIEIASRGCETTGWKDPKLRHTLSMAYANRSISRRQAGDFRGAIDDGHRAVEADPDYDAPRFNLAQLLSSCPEASLRDPAAAVEQAERACSLAAALDAGRLAILAQAHAAAGNLAEARAAAARAIERARPDEEELVASLRFHLQTQWNQP